jgi:hypothetical protein
MTALLSILSSILTGKAGEQVGGAVAGVGQLVALFAALAPVALWLLGHREEVFISITFGELAFWGAVLCGFVIVVLRLVHRAPPP